MPDRSAAGTTTERSRECWQWMMRNFDVRMYRESLQMVAGWKYPDTAYSTTCSHLAFASEASLLAEQHASVTGYPRCPIWCVTSRACNSSPPQEREKHVWSIGTGVIARGIPFG